MDSNELLEQVRHTVHFLEPDAEVILYGSRARGDANAESDWDFLVLVDGPVDEERKNAIRHRLYEIEWACGEVLSALVCSREDWNSPRYQRIPLHKTVEREGRVL